MSGSNFFNSMMIKAKTLTPPERNRLYIALALIIVLTGVLAFALMRHSAADAAFLTATLKETQGDVKIKQPGQSDFSAAMPGTVLQLHGQLQTGSSSTARLDLSSGTIIRVAPSSLFTLEANKQTANGMTTTLTLTLGQIFIILKGGSLDVNVPSGVASVRGSFMSALIYPASDKIFVQCLEGHCAAINGVGELDLTDGQKGIFVYAGQGSDQFPLQTVMNQNDYAGWLAISPEAQDLINQKGNNQGQGSSSGNCIPTHDHPCK